MLRRIRSADQHDDAGFGLLEVLVSITLFVIVVVGATTGVLSAIDASHGGQQRVDAANVAQSVLAQAMAPGTSLATGSTTFDSQVGDGSAASKEQFSVTRTVGSCTSGLRTVNVEVRQKQNNRFLARTDSVVACTA